MSQTTSIPENKIQNLRSDYVEFKEIKNDFQFLDVGRFDPDKLTPDNRKIHFIEIYGDYNEIEASLTRHIDALTVATLTVNGNVRFTITFQTGPQTCK